MGQEEFTCAWHMPSSPAMALSALVFVRSSPYAAAHHVNALFHECNPREQPSSATIPAVFQQATFIAMLMQRSCHAVHNLPEYATYTSPKIFSCLPAVRSTPDTVALKEFIPIHAPACHVQHSTCVGRDQAMHAN